MYRIHEIKLKIGEGREVIPDKIKKRLKTRAEITEYRVVKESIDARDKKNIRYSYTVDFCIDGEFPDLEKASGTTYRLPTAVTKKRSGSGSRIVIAGFGPCGMFAALILAECGYAPLIIERGKDVDERLKDVTRFWKDGVLNEESNVQFGEGGAGAFSDGKLTTGIKDSRVRKVLEELALAGAGDDILYKQKPHVGTDVLRDVVKNIREKIISNGGEILYSTRLDGITVGEGRLAAVAVFDKNGTGEIDTGSLILATGHSARDTFRTLHKAGLYLEQKPFSIGVRIEHPQEIINAAQYGVFAGGLPPAEYQLAHRCKDGRGVYTFCMCPGGEVIVASSQQGGLVTNGMSMRARSGEYANSALLVDVKTSDFKEEGPLAGIAFQEQYERLAYKMAGRQYKPPQSAWGEFANSSESALPVINSVPAFATGDIIEAMPAFAKKIKGFDSREARVYAVESRSSSPVRIKRNEHFMSNIEGIYPGGEGAGYAGGIVSSAVDGIKIAEEIISRGEQ